MFDTDFSIRSFRFGNITLIRVCDRSRFEKFWGTSLERCCLVVLVDLIVKVEARHLPALHAAGRPQLAHAVDHLPADPRVRHERPARRRADRHLHDEVVRSKRQGDERNEAGGRQRGGARAGGVLRLMSAMIALYLGSSNSTTSFMSRSFSS